jgi:hypothetical protein
MTNNRSNKKNGFYWYDTLTEEQKGMWFNDFVNEVEQKEFTTEIVESFLNNYFRSFREFLMTSFLWEESEEGYDYWDNLSFRN